MKRIGILTAGGDTPALNATIWGAVQRANQLRIEVFGIIKGYSGLLNPQVPHVHLNPLFQGIPELDATRGMLQGKLKLKGDLPTIVRYTKASQEMTECTTRVPVTWPDE